MGKLSPKLSAGCRSRAEAEIFRAGGSFCDVDHERDFAMLIGRYLNVANRTEQRGSDQHILNKLAFMGDARKRHNKTKPLQHVTPTSCSGI